MTDERDDYKVIDSNGKTLFTGTETRCDEFAWQNAKHGEVVPPEGD